MGVGEGSLGRSKKHGARRRMLSGCRQVQVLWGNGACTGGKGEGPPHGDFKSSWGRLGGKRGQEQGIWMDKDMDRAEHSSAVSTTIAGSRVTAARRERRRQKL